MRELISVTKVITTRGQRSEHNIGFGCSRCGWLFEFERPYRGIILEEIIRNFNDERDEEFDRHDCKQYPRVKT